jgi:flagellar biosynthetic protein FliR
MPAELPVANHLLFSFLFVLARVAGLFTFVPIPGIRAGFDAPKLILSISLAFGLAGYWPKAGLESLSIGDFVFILLRELLLGTAVGLLVGFLAETFLLAFQIPALQAGYTYASTIDPSTSADSNVLQMISQLASGLMFFGLGMHRAVIGAITTSMISQPPGGPGLTDSALVALSQAAQSMFGMAIRLALPVVSMLLMVDLILACMSRLNNQLQLITLIFPMKMLIALFMFASLVGILPALYQDQMSRILAAVAQLLSP